MPQIKLHIHDTRKPGHDRWRVTFRATNVQKHADSIVISEYGPTEIHATVAFTRRIKIEQPRLFERAMHALNHF